MLGLAFKLPYAFDPVRLQADLKRADDFQFSKHPLRYHNGQWLTLNLIYSGGRIEYTHEGDLGYGNEPPAATPVLHQCPYFREVIDAIPGEKNMVRLSVLPPGGKILTHYDPVESADFGFVRVHIPVQTDESVRFYLARWRYRWRAGETWYGDFTFPHAVYNDTPVRRVHMIIDLKMDDAVRQLFPTKYFDQAPLRARYRKLHKNLCWYEDKLKRSFKGKSAAAS